MADKYTNENGVVYNNAGELMVDISNQTDQTDKYSPLTDGSVASEVLFRGSPSNKIETDQELLDMDTLAANNPAKYLSKYKEPKDWTLDEKEAQLAQVVRTAMLPDQTSSIGTVAYAGGEALRNTQNMFRKFKGYVLQANAALSDVDKSLFFPNADKEEATRIANNYEKVLAQRERTRADFVANRGVDEDVYNYGTMVFEVARDIATGVGVGKVVGTATKSGILAGGEFSMAQKFAEEEAKRASSKAVKKYIGAETFIRTAGDRATKNVQDYIDKTGDKDLKYYDPTVDFAVNTGVSALSSVIEASLGVERFVPDLLLGNRALGKVATEGLKSFLGEYAEEVFQNITEQTGDVISGYADKVDILKAIVDGLPAGIIGGAFGTTAAGGMYYLNRRRMVRQFQDIGLDKNVAADLTDKILRDGINKTLSNLSSAIELKNQNGQAYDKLKAGIKNSLEVQGWKDKISGDIDEYVNLVAPQMVNKAIEFSMMSGLSIDTFLNIAEFGNADNVLYIKPLGTQEQIKARIAEQSAIIKRQTELRKTGAGDKGLLDAARTKKAILEKALVSAQIKEEIKKVNLEDAKTPEKTKEINQANEDADSLTNLDSVEQFNTELDSKTKDGIPLTSEQKSKRFGNAVIKKIFGKDKLGFESVITLPEYATARQAIANIAPRIFEYAKKHRTYNLYKDLRAALNKMRTVNSDNFIESVKSPDFNGVDTVAQNAFLYHFLFKDVNTTTAFLDAYIERATASVENKTKTSLRKFDLVGQSFKAIDNMMQMQANAAGIEYNSIYNADGKTIADKNVAAVFFSSTTQFAGEPTQLFLFHTEQSDGLMTTNSIFSVINKLRGLKAGSKYRMLYDVETKNWYLADANNITHIDMFLKAFEQGNYDEFNDKREAEEFFNENYLANEQRLLSFLGEKFDTKEKAQGKLKKTLENDEYTCAYLNDNVVIYARYETDLSDSGFSVKGFDQYKIDYDKDGNRVIKLDKKASGTQLFQRASINGMYDPELGVVLLGKNFNTMTLPHEFAHYWLDTLFNVYKRIQAGELQSKPEFIQYVEEMFDMLGINKNQNELTRTQQEKFATMTEAYLTGIGISENANPVYKEYLKWIPEKYNSLQQLAYLDENNKLQNVFLDERAVDFFNAWYNNTSLPSLSTSPERQRFMNVTGDNGDTVRVSIKEMNDREKEFAQDAEEQIHTDQRLYNTLAENMPADIKAGADAQKVVIYERSNFLKESETQQKEAKEEPERRWYERKSRETETQKAKEYINKNPEKAREVIYGDPELIPNTTGIDRATLINTYMALNNITPEHPDWAKLHTNIAINQSLAGTQLALSNDKSYGAYLDALREVENALELKAATNYAGSKRGAIERFNRDIDRFLDSELPTIFATEPNSQERETALRMMFEKARTQFSGNTTGSFLNQLDLNYAKVQKGKSEAFIRWAKNQIKKDAGAKLNDEQQANLLKISAKAQQALIDLDNKDSAKAVAAAQEILKWQVEKNKMMGISPKKFSILGDWMPRAMLASINTLVVANIPSTAINTAVVRALNAGLAGKNNVSSELIEKEIKRIKAIYGASGMNLAQMEKPTSPSLLHGEKYATSGQKWYDPYTILGKEDNWFRVPTFVNTLARIASTDAKATGRKADDVFNEYLSLNNQSDSAKLARKQALAVANMAVFTQNGTLSSSLNHIRSQLNNLSRGLIGLEPGGFGIGSLLSPFLTTGANIAEMGIRGSLAPVTQITAMVKKWRTGKEIDPLKKLALRMDWTYFVLSAVSMVLLSALTSDDDEFYTDPYITGRKYDPNKPYDSINIAGVWLDLDFFGPFSIPMRTAAKAIQAWKADNGLADSITKAYGESAKNVLGDIPLVESVFNNQISWATKKTGDWATSYIYNQANKLIPAIVKPASRAISRATDTEFEATDKFGKIIGRKFQRNYGFDGAELTYQDLIELFTIKVQLDEEINKPIEN